MASRRGNLRADPVPIQAPSFKKKIASEDPFVNNLGSLITDPFISGIIVPSFKRDDPLPRTAFDFVKQLQLDEALHGQKVQLSDKTLKKLLTTYQDDPLDLAWIQEKKRLVDAGDNDSLPFGRTQRQVEQTINIADAAFMSSKSLDDRFNLLDQALRQGLGDTMDGLGAIGLQVTAILKDTKLLQNMSAEDWTRLSQVINRFGVPGDWSQRFDHRMWTVDEVKAQKPLIYEFLLSNIPIGRSALKPIVSVSKKGSKQASQLEVIFESKNKDKILDLGNRQFIPRAIAEKMIIEEGIDSGKLSGKVLTASSLPKQIIIGGKELDLKMFNPVLVKDIKYNPNKPNIPKDYNLKPNLPGTRLRFFTQNTPTTNPSPIFGLSFQDLKKEAKDILSALDNFKPSDDRERTELIGLYQLSLDIQTDNLLLKASEGNFDKSNIKLFL